MDLLLPLAPVDPVYQDFPLTLAPPEDLYYPLGREYLSYLESLVNLAILGALYHLELQVFLVHL